MLENSKRIEGKDYTCSLKISLFPDLEEIFPRPFPDLWQPCQRFLLNQTQKKKRKEKKKGEEEEIKRKEINSQCAKKNVKEIVHHCRYFLKK